MKEIENKIIQKIVDVYKCNKNDLKIDYFIENLKSNEDFTIFESGTKNYYLVKNEVCNKRFIVDKITNNNHIGSILIDY